MRQLICRELDEGRLPRNKNGSDKTIRDLQLASVERPEWSTTFIFFRKFTQLQKQGLF